MAEKKTDLEREDFFENPNANGNVWPFQRCPAFSPRVDAFENNCWHCRYADFHLDREKPLEVGICCFPKLIT
jgi:hypothetical protein